MKPLLAATLKDPSKLPWPVMVSAKYDGIRALKFENQLTSRNLKPIRNLYIQACLSHLPNGLDGELVVGPPNRDLVFNRTSSGVMSEGGEPDFKYYVFDIWNSQLTYEIRCRKLGDTDGPFVEVVAQKVVRNLDEFYEEETNILGLGYEGVMVRSSFGKYKFGRATDKDQIIWKWKRFTDGEALVLNIEEGQKNLNETRRDLLGYKERSTNQENMAPNGMVGTILAKDVKSGLLLHVSPGRMEHNQRLYYWRNPEELIGRIIKYKTFDYGKATAPRFTTFQGIRHADDM